MESESIMTHEAKDTMTEDGDTGTLSGSVTSDHADIS